MKTPSAVLLSGTCVWHGFCKGWVHRLLQIGIVGNSFCKVRTVSQIAAAVHRLLQIGIVGNLASLDANDKAAASGSPITSNRNSWKRTELKNIRTSALLLVHRLLQIGIVGNSQIAAETLMTSPSCSPITSNRNSWKLFDLPTESLYSSRVHRLLQIGIVGNYYSFPISRLVGFVAFTDYSKSE